MGQCNSKNSLIFQHTNEEKHLYEFTEEQLKTFSLNYLIENATPLELLYTWHKLPEAYRFSYELRNCLPCFIHDFYPEGPSSQAKCGFCEYSIQHNPFDIPEYPPHIDVEKYKKKF